MITLKNYFITGTDTEIGKTHAAMHILREWKQQGRHVAAMKPIASGATRNAQGEWVNDDVERLISVTGQSDRALMNPYCFEPPIAPHIAAQAAGVTIDLDRITHHYKQLSTHYEAVLVEGAGGWLAPLSVDLDMADLAKCLNLPVILVVGMKLGCLNHARLTAHAIEASGCHLAGWVANQLGRDQAAYKENLATLQMKISAPLLAEIPYSGSMKDAPTKKC